MDFIYFSNFPFYLSFMIQSGMINREIFRLMNKYEDLVIKIQKEAKQFRHENSKLKESLAEIIEENNQLKARDNDDSIAEFRKEYINVADRIFNNLHNQLFLINQVHFDEYNFQLPDIFMKSYYPSYKCFFFYMLTITETSMT